MNYDEMQRRVYALLRDTDKQFISDEEVEDWLNQAQRDLALRLGAVQPTATGTVSAGGLITIPTDAVEIVDLRLSDDDVEFKDYTYYFEKKDGGSYVTPTIATTFNGSIELYPDPGLVAYSLRYRKLPSDLTEGSTTPSLSKELQDRMVNFATAMGLYKEREIDLGDRYMQMYERGLPSSTLGKGLERPGPFSLVYEAGPWDVDASHRG